MSMQESRETGSMSLRREKEDNPRASILRLKRDFPDDSRDQLFARFRSMLDDNPDQQRAVDWYFFVNTWEYEYTGRNVKTPAARERQAQQLLSRVESVKEQIVLLALTMPNGKAMRDCTGQEMKAFGRAYERIAERVGRSTVGEVLKEADIRKLMGK